MKLALCFLVALTGCTATNVPVPSGFAPGMKRSDVAALASRPPVGQGRSRRGHLLSPASRNLRRPPLAAPTHRWSAVAECESSGNWHTNTGNGYYGGLQEGLTFWANYGGLAFAARPDLASKAQQIVVAERGLAVQGAGAWPRCGVYLGGAS